MLRKEIEEIRNQGEWKGYFLVREIYQIHGSFLLLTMVFIIMVIITIIGRIG
jgi:hypothetical protein